MTNLAQELKLARELKLRMDRHYWAYRRAGYGLFRSALAAFNLLWQLWRERE
jgi:hypothetical protein